MCGISGIFGHDWNRAQLEAMIGAQTHRGPDDRDVYLDPSHLAGLGHNRLSIIDLSSAGRQPLASPDGRYQLIFNGEIYNYRELRRELSPFFSFRSSCDSEVLLAAWMRWGRGCLDRLLGMFAFVVWDQREQSLFAVRDRFGVKPLYYHYDDRGNLKIASEIKALHEAGIPREPDPALWATYLCHGYYEHSPQTFWRGIRQLPPGHFLRWREGAFELGCWYDLAERVGDEEDDRPLHRVMDEYEALLEESLRLRFRADVNLGVNLSGGLDSSLLLGFVQKLEEPCRRVKAFTFVTGDPRYDELPWVRQMLARTEHQSVVAELSVEQVPDLARVIQDFQDEPFGGLPTLAYARLFETARDHEVTVLLDGQGMDEQWAGYDYYRLAGSGRPAPTIQGSRSRPVRPECLTPGFRAQAQPFTAPTPFIDPLRNLQYRDIRFTKIPRALRFNDRISMRVSRELREPFLDHRMVELALRQPAARKIKHGQGKWFLRELARRRIPDRLVEAPKRPLQTPQREWLSGPLRPWLDDCFQTLAGLDGSWLDWKTTQKTWNNFCRGDNDHSFFVWQWLSLALLLDP